MADDEEGGLGAEDGLNAFRLAGRYYLFTVEVFSTPVV